MNIAKKKINYFFLFVLTSWIQMGLIDIIICQFYIMKVVKSRAFKDRLKGHKESVLALFSPYGEQGHMLYSISKDRSVRGNPLNIQDGISPSDRSQ